jgi:hypothetical protein
MPAMKMEKQKSKKEGTSAATTDSSLRMSGKTKEKGADVFRTQILQKD